MIGKLTYDQLLECIEQLKTSNATVTTLIENKESYDLENFVGVVDRYIKYLETTLELYKDADKALARLAEANKRTSQQKFFFYTYLLIFILLK